MKLKIYKTTLLLTILIAAFSIKAQSIVGYSELFTFNTKYQITGNITNSSTGLPVEGAIVETLVYSSFPTNEAGEYTLFVPFGYGYTLLAIAENYETQYVYNVHVPQNNPEALVDFVLSPSSGEATLATFNPDPNPGISTVFQGAILHRYYKTISNSTGNPFPLRVVKVIGDNFEQYYLSDENGKVDIEINSDQVGLGIPGSQMAFSIVEVSGQPLSEPIEFICKVEKLNYEKYWDNYAYAKLGGNLLGADLSVEVEMGSVTSISNGNSAFSDPEKLNISRQGRAGVGVGFKIKSPGAKGQLGPIKGGAGAEAGLGAKFMGVTEDNYQFEYDITNNWQAVAEYILIADGNYKSIDNAMIRFLSVLEENFAGNSTLEESFVSDGVGIDVSVNASAEAFAGVEVTENATLGAGANIGTEGHVTFNAYNHHVDNEYEFNFGVSGKFAGSAGAGLKMDFDNNGEDDIGTMLNVWDTESSRGLQFSTFLNANNPNHIERFELKFIRRNFISKFEEEITYSIEGDEVAGAIANLTSEIQQISNFQNAGSNIKVKNTTFKQILNAVFAFLYDVQANQSGEANISYQKDLTRIDHSTSFDVSLDLSLTAVALNIGGGAGFEQGKKMTIEKGKWAYGKTYLNQEYLGDIPEIATSYQQVLQGIVDEVPLWLRLLIGTVNAIVPGKDDATFYLGNNGSYIIFPDGAFPVGLDSLHCSSWSWYGNDPSKKIQGISRDSRGIYRENKQRAEEVFGMQYGFGGFYQFDPYGNELPDTCWMTIVYNQEEVDSIDESTLGMYWEDKANHQWVYLGGVLDTIENKVTAPITELSLFTLAPAMPYGAFGLNALPDSIYADSISVATIFSDTIFNNNLTPVSNGEKFTVSTTYGKVISADADTTVQGIQVVAANHQIQLEVQSSHIGGKAKVSAFSVNGSANASTELRFYDTIPPSAPVLANVIPDSITAKLFWIPNTEDDLSGYVMYFDTDTIPPFNGIHTIFGQPSPIYTGTDTSRAIYGLFNDTTYYFAVTAVDVEGNESDYSNFVQATPWAPTRQTIQLAKGWSGISSYVIPETDNVEPMFESILDELIILQNSAGMFWPGQNVNTLGAWNTHEGYQIKVANNVEINFSGSRENNKTLQLTEGWNLIPILSECEVDAAVLFDGTDVIMVKEVAGWNIYWPGFGINTLEIFEPGKAYFVLMNSEAVISFPECTPIPAFPLKEEGTDPDSNHRNDQNGTQYKKSNFQRNVVATCVGTPSPSGEGWGEVKKTPSTHTIAIPKTVMENLEIHNVGLIKAYDLSGNCFGAGIWQDESTSITLFGDDPLTETKDGFDENESIEFRLWNPENDEEQLLHVSFDPTLPNPEKAFVNNGLSAIASMKVSTSGISDNHDELNIQIIPNPAKDEFMLSIASKISQAGILTIFSLEGQRVGYELIENDNTRIDIHHLESGIYILQIEMNGNTVNKKLLKY